MEKEEKSKKEEVKYEMGGPIGALFFIVFFTGLLAWTTEKCHSGRWEVFRIPQFPTNFDSYVDVNVSFGLLIWFMCQCVLYILPIGGEIMEGPALVNNSGVRLKYRLNGLFVAVVNLACLGMGALMGFPVTMVSDYFLQMLTSGLIFIFCLSFIIYLKGTVADKSLLNPNGNTGHVFYDWFMGKELSPRFGSLDLKYVIFRSGIIGWILFNCINVLKSYEQNQGHLNATLLLVTVMQMFYVADTFWFEDGIVVSRDIVHEGLGFNILLQFLMIPFTFCVQTRYLMQTNYSIQIHWLVVVAILYLTGYWIFRGSNSEKNNYRRNPKDPALAHLKTMKTKRGTNLLISGWWGMSRHPNYFGDLIISFSSALPTGFNHFMPYLNPLFLVFLLIDREEKDGAICKKKYGDDWDRYCQHVKYRIIPYVY